jgi:hypothetical protein
MRPYTTTAMRSGWCWEIPQWHERHLGYVYCSAFASDEEFVQRFGITGPTRIVHFSAGRRADFVRGWAPCSARRVRRFRVEGAATLDILESNAVVRKYRKASVCWKS